MIRAVHTFQAGVALATLNRQFANWSKRIDPLRDLIRGGNETRSYQILLAQPALLPPQRAVSNHAAVVANDRFLEQRGR